MKKLFISLVARFVYWLGIDALFYYLNRRAKRILTFHSVMPDGLFNDGTTMLSDSEATFRNKIRLLKSRWSFSNDLNDPTTLTITFDDGFKNEVEIAGEILREEGNIPAILFVAISLIGQSDPLKSLVVDLLMHWNASVPEGQYWLHPFEKKIEYNSNNRLEVWCGILRPLYASDGANMGRAVLKACNDAYPLKEVLGQFSQEYLRLRLSGVTREDIDEVVRRGWRVGSHSVNHYVFSSLDTHMKISELETEPEMKKTVFSYPYGEMMSIDSETIKLVKDAGYPGAVSNLPDGGGRNDKYFLPRMALSENKYLIHFELSGLKTFLKSGRLLPIVKV